MTFIVATYDPSQVELIVASHKVEGWSSITVTKDTPSFTKVQGIRGKNTRTRNKNSGCSIQVNLIQTSYSNNVFSEIVKQDRLSGKGRIEMLLKDLGGDSLLQSKEAYLVDYSPMGFSAEIGNRVWLIDCLSTFEYRAGGNVKSPAGIFNSAVGGASRYFGLN